MALVQAISEAQSDGDARAIEERRAANEASHRLFKDIFDTIAYLTLVYTVTAGITLTQCNT